MSRPVLPAPPAVCAELVVRDLADTTRVFLAGIHRWGRAVLDATPDAHLDGDELTPAVEDGPATVHWLVGYRMGAHEHPGDSVDTFSLVVEVAESGDARALWYRTTADGAVLFAGGGVVDPGADGAAAWLELGLMDTGSDEELSIEGLVRGV